MDIVTLVPLVISAVVPYLQKGIGKIVEKTAEAGFEQRGKIWSLVKGLLPDNDLTLTKFLEENPDDAKAQGKLEGKLEERLKDKPDVAKELEELINTINQTSVNSSVNINRQDGEINVNSQGNQNSSFTFNQK